MANNDKRLIFRRLIFNKYLIVFVVFVVFVTFFDEHNLIQRWKTDRKINELEKEADYYRQEIIKNKQKTTQLESSQENLEKFAREHYYMKNDNEDIFIINEECTKK